MPRKLGRQISRSLILIRCWNKSILLADVEDLTNFLRRSPKLLFCLLKVSQRQLLITVLCNNVLDSAFNDVFEPALIIPKFITDGNINANDQDFSYARTCR